MNKQKRIEVHQKFNGHCSYCGKKIKYKEMQVDHQVSKANNGTDEMTNLYPSCRSCNHYKRSMNLESFRKYMMTLHERVSKPYISRVALDYGIIDVKPFSGVFYFEEEVE